MRSAVTAFASVMCLFLSQSALAADASRPGSAAPGSILFKAAPHVIHVATLKPDLQSATVTDVETADFNGDGRVDIAAAWTATDPHDRFSSVRVLTLFFNAGATFERGADIDLYIPHPTNAGLSVFRYGTGDIGIGDFDGDGDVDLAVGPDRGDELWIIENTGHGTFVPRVFYPFGFNSSTLCITPPEFLAADFDGDGRQELVYLVDPVQTPDGQFVHFWMTSNSIANLERAYWEGADDGVAISWTRALAVADFDGDGRPDLCFTATRNPPAYERYAVLTVWYHLDFAAQMFSVRREYPSIVCSDVADVRPIPGCLPGLLLTDINGTTVQYWSRACIGVPDFWQAAEITGYAGLSPNRGVTAIVADVNADGAPDLVTRQKLGAANDHDQIELTFSTAQGAAWTRVSPSPIDASGFQNIQAEQVLRPRNLAVADLFGNTLPEIVAGFAAAPPSIVLAGERANALDIAVWPNSCLADVNRDGRTDPLDRALLIAALGTSAADPAFNADADFNKNSTIGDQDWSMFNQDLGCQCCGPCAGQLLADSNCDGALTQADWTAFTVAMSQGEAGWERSYGGAGCDFLCVNDANDDGRVDFFDIHRFTEFFLPPLTEHNVPMEAR